MGRSKLLSDGAVLGRLLTQLERVGPGGLTFAKASEAAGLTAASLVQRFGARDAMVEAVLLHAWDRLDAATAAADAEAPATPAGVIGSGVTNAATRATARSFAVSDGSVQATFSAATTPAGVIAGATNEATNAVASSDGVSGTAKGVRWRSVATVAGVIGSGMVNAATSAAARSDGVAGGKVRTSVARTSSGVIGTGSVKEATSATAAWLGANAGSGNAV